MAAKTRKFYTTNCIDCGTETTTITNPQSKNFGGVSCGSATCRNAHNNRVAAFRSESARQGAATRAARTERTATTLVGDGSWAHIAYLNGVNVDGTKRR